MMLRSHSAVYKKQIGRPALLLTHGIHAAPLRANPNKTCGARRGKRE